MKDNYKAYTVSHDEADIPTYTHEVIITNNRIGNTKVLGIVDENKDHIPHLNKYTMKEVDVDSRYWLHNGQLGGHYRIYDGPKSQTLEYIFKLTIKQAELITKNKLFSIGICSPTGALYFIGRSYCIENLENFIKIKKHVDPLPIHPRYWEV